MVDEAVSKYGNIMAGINAEKVGKINGKWKSIPFIAATTGYFIRGDKLKDKGIDPTTLKTFEDRRAAALAISDPDGKFWGWGLTPNQSGDGYGFLISVIQAFGGHYTDKTGMIVQFNSPETAGGGDVAWPRPTTARASTAPCCRRASRAGATSPTTRPISPAASATRSNAFSVYAQAKRDKNPVFPDTVLLTAPQANNGDSRDGGNVGGWLTIFKGAPNADLGKKLALDLLDPANFTKMSEVAGGLFMPAYENLWTEKLLAADPNFKIIKEQVSVKDPFIGASWPANPNAAIDAIRAQGVIEQMTGNVIAGRMNPADAVKDAHNKIVQIFEEGGIMQPK